MLQLIKFNFRILIVSHYQVLHHTHKEI